MKGRRRIAYRDSKNGRFLSKKQAARKNPATVEKERLRVGRRRRSN